MRIGNIQPGRPAYYDRNPTTVQLVTRIFNNAPANFVDVTYTVPTNRAAYLQAASAKVVRVGAAGVLGRSNAIVEYLQGGSNIVDICEAEIRKNATGDSDSAQFSGIGLLKAGEKMQTEIQSTDTGGGVDTLANAWLVEFDA
jgi:hypothetical protein